MGGEVSLATSANAESVKSKTVGPKTAWRWIADCVWNFSALTICLLAAGAIISLFARSHWFFDLAANLRVQQVIAIGGGAVITILFRRWRWLAFTAVLLAFHLPSLSTAWMGQPNANADPDLTIMVVNVLTSNSHHDLVLNQVEAADADVFAIVELGTPLANRLRKATAETYPYHAGNSQDRGNFGIGLYSKYPVKDDAIFVLNEDRIWSIEATVSKDDQNYRIAATHPLPPMGRRKFRSRNQHLNQLVARVNEFQQQDRATPVIVMGDFNLTPWSPLFADLQQESGLRRSGQGTGLTPTWYAKPAFPFGLKLDHILISDQLECTDHKIGNAIGSDHRAVVAGLRYVEQ